MRSIFRKPIIGVDKTLLVQDAAKLMPEPSRRRFLTGGASLGALTLLTGCEVFDSLSAENLLTQMSKFNDKVQSAIFNPNALAPTYPPSAITRPFPFNAYYTLDDAPEIDAKDWELEVTGLVAEQEVLEARGALRAAAGDADHAAHLRGRLERDRQLDRRAPERIPEARRRRHAARNMSGFAAPKVTRRRSTCRRHCIRRRR